MDWDAKYTEGLRGLLEGDGLEVIRLPPRSPNLNAFAERFVRTIKEKCVDRMIFFGQSSLERALGQYIAHYHSERNHQGVGNRLLRGPTAFARHCGPVRRRERLGGMLSFYHREAA
jgi:transposase InsO family protein